MNKGLYSKLAGSNMKRNKNTYFPYIFSSIVIVSLFYILLTIRNRVGQVGFYGDSTMHYILSFGVFMIGIFSVLFIFYTNSFLLKRRTKELGLYSVLGMEKKHIVKVLFYEIIYSGLISIGLGMVSGIIFSRLMFAILLNILNFDTSISLKISWYSIGITILFFAVIFLLVILSNVIRIYRINPIDLITGEKKGEREPKSNWFLGLMGIVLLGAGYYLALTIDNPISAINMFFVAVGLVALGTYFIFTSGSIILIKALRKNKKFYYQKNHFISISNMIYRMKQNAVGLANIAILSTGVLLILSTTISLFVGMEDVMKTRYPRDVFTNYIYENNDVEEIEKVILEHANDNNLKINNTVKYFNAGLAGYLIDNEITQVETEGKISFSDFYGLGLITLEDYNSNNKLNVELKEGQVLFFANINKYNYKDIIIYGERYEIKEKLGKIDFMADPIFNQVVIVLPDMEEMERLVSKINEFEGGNSAPIYYDYQFDIEGNHDDKITFASSLRSKLNESIERVGGVEDRYTSRSDFLSIYGSLFFIGIFLGSLFMIATVLIIYYKQISEGYDDKERFVILQKVGMSKKEIKKTIGNQILLVFFLPLVTAIIHIIVAFPLVSKILAILNLTNTKLFLSFTGIVILVFALGYGIVYKWTARIYFRIVN